MSFSYRVDRWSPDRRRRVLLPTSRLFRNDLTVGPNGQRKLHFTDVTERAGVALQAYGMGVAVGDYDNDGYLDLFVTSFGPETLFHNNGERNLHRRDGTGRRDRPALEHERGVHRLRPRRRPRSLRRELSGLHAGRQQGVSRFRGLARLLQPSRVPSGARQAVSQRRQRQIHERHGNRRHQQGRRGGSRRRNGRLRRRWLARSLRRQRRDAESALDQPARRNVRRRGADLGGRGQRRGQSRRQHGHRVGRLRR